jgi:ABC-2 type transport system permease protein
MFRNNTTAKYWKTITMVAAGEFHDSRVGIVASFGLRLLRLVILLSLWRTVFADRDLVGGMHLADVLTYTLIAEVFSGQMVIRTALSGSLWEGTIVHRLIRPIGIHGQFIGEMIGDWVPRLCLHSVPLLLIGPFLGVDVTPDSVAAGLLFVVSLSLGVAIGAAMDVIFVALMVSLDHDVSAPAQVRDAIALIASGSVIPLALLPWHLGDALTWLPFASLASAPLRIYTGTGDASFLLLLQAAWAVILWPCAHFLWCRSRERIAAHGG